MFRALIFYKYMGLKNKLEVYTDGSHKGHFGAWAFIILSKGKVLLEVSGRVEKTCSNRMEFQAAIEALKALPKKSHAIFYSDSRILVDTMTLWKSDWKQYGWIKKNGRPIPNVDLIIELDFLSSSHELEWKWIRAHAGITYNERCDELCTQLTALE
jgi:ribonuclease HI